MKTHIIWDWNGTLLNDVALCIRLLGDLLRHQGKPPVSREKYLEIFGFPISTHIIIFLFLSIRIGTTSCCINNITNSRITDQAVIIDPFHNHSDLIHMRSNHNFF